MPSEAAKKVLVSVNDLQTRQRLSVWFQDNGYDPVNVHDVESVKAQVCENTQLVISGIESSDENPTHFTQLIRSVSANLPIILVSAADSVSNAVLCLQGGATDFLLKPISEAELSVKVNRAIKERHLQNELATLRGSKFPNLFADGTEIVQQEIKTLQRIEREAIVKALDSYAGARGKTAKALGISVRTLQRKIKEYGYTHTSKTQDRSYSSVNQTSPLNN